MPRLTVYSDKHTVILDKLKTLRTTDSQKHAQSSGLLLGTYLLDPERALKEFLPQYADRLRLLGLEGIAGAEGPFLSLMTHCQKIDPLTFDRYTALVNVALGAPGSIGNAANGAGMFVCDMASLDNPLVGCGSHPAQQSLVGRREAARETFFRRGARAWARACG